MQHATPNTRKSSKGLFLAAVSALAPIGLALATIGLSSPAAAQELEEFSLEDMLEQVIVTARKREDLIQEVPLSVSVLTTTQIEDRAIRDLQDISQETPGLVYENYATAGLSTAAVIRGMGQTFTAARIQNTAVFLDGIYLQRQSMINPGLLDMERVEVVKGPQNAQFGRNAFAGAIQYVTKQPPSEFTANLMLGYGNGDRFDRRFEVGGPLIDGELAVRLSAGQSDFDGHSDNYHPFANDGPGYENATNGMLGGWRDAVYSTGVTWTPTAPLKIDFAYYYNETLREPQAYYDLNGARYAFDSGEFGGPPFFAFLAPTGTNCLNTATFSDRLPFPARGMHAWCGELPTSPPVLDDPNLAAAGHADSRGNVAVDPRSLALDANTHIGRLNIGYDVNKSLSVSYQLGYVDHQADNFGTTEGRASLLGSAVAYVPVQTSPAPPFISALGPPGSFGALARTSVFYGNPLEQLTAISHELRLTWSGENLVARGGIYLSDNDDEDGGRWHFVPPCEGGVHCRVPVPAGDSVLAGRYIAVVPVVPGQLNVGVPHIFDAGHGVLADHVTYQDEVRALFGDVEWLVRDGVTLAIEARVTREDKSFEQLSTTFGGALPDNVAASDEETFNFFTPRAILKWTPTDANMLYALVAKGVKTGGFNAVDPAQNPEQATYDEESNVTLEFGAKNLLLDGRLTLNAAVYAIDWQDVQGTEAASSADAWTRDVVGNIGDADVVGIEVEGAWSIGDRFFVDYGLAYSDAKYESGVYLSSVAGRNSSWGCNDTVCRADGRVDGKRIERTSKNQYNLGLNHTRPIGNANAIFRIDFNYRGNMFATPMNLAHNGSRTLTNASFTVGGEKWQLALWGRNILDEEYVANSFVLPSFNRYIVGLGARRTFGLTFRYGM